MIRSIIRNPATIAFLAAILILSLGGWQILHSRSLAMTHGYEDARNLSRTLAEHSERTIETVDIVLSGIVDRIEHGALVNAPAFKDFLDVRSKTIRQVGAIIVLDDHGMWAVTGGKTSKPGMSSADRHFFQTHIAIDDRRLHIDTVIASRIDGHQFIPLSRRWNKPDGTFGGVVLASLDPAYFEAFYAKIGIGKSGAIALISDSGRFLVRHPYDPNFAQRDLSRQPLFVDALSRSPSGQLRYRAVLDGNDRIAGYEHLKNYPLVITAAESVDDVLSSWQSEAALEAAGLLAAALLFVALGIVSARSQKRHARAEAQIRERETLYRMLADALPQMVWVVRSGDYRQTYANRQFQLYYGPIGADEGARLLRYHPEDAIRMNGEWDAAKVGGHSYLTEGRLQRHDGAYRWHKLVVIPVTRNASIVEWIATALDIDDIIVARRHLQETTDLLHLSQEAAEAGTWDFNLRTNTITLSRDSARLHGLEAEDAVTIDADAWQRLVAPEDGPRILSLVSKAVGQRSTYTGEFQLAQSARWLSGVGRAYYDEAGAPVRMIGLNFDVTDRKRAEGDILNAHAAAETARRDAERASAAKSDFLASMSHEIRTPLNAIIGYTDLLLDEPLPSTDHARKLKLIQESGSALLTVVNDILNFSKIEAGQIDLDYTSFSPRALVETVTSMLTAMAVRKHIALTAFVDPAVPAHVLGDADRLRQILLNLVNNAVKFTNAGSVAIRVGLEHVVANRASLRFVVQDSGIGITADQQKRLFQRFSQVDGSITRRFGGTGLGLAICKQLVDLMGGTIGVDSSDGEGASFWFCVSLPVEDPAVVAPREKAADAVVAERAAWILLVEDVAINQELARSVLERSGHKVDVACNGAEAVDLIRSNCYDLVLMDVQMPVMDGITATKIIRDSDHAHTAVPIIAMTANVLPQQIASLRTSGMDDHVGKPFKRIDLLAAVDRWTNKASVSR